MTDELYRLLSELRTHLIAHPPEPTPIVLEQTAPDDGGFISRLALEWARQQKLPADRHRLVEEAIRQLMAEAGELKKLLAMIQADTTATKGDVATIKADVATVKADTAAIKKKVLGDSTIPDPDFIARVKRQIVDARAELATIEGQLDTKLRDFPVPPTSNATNRRRVTGAQADLRTERTMLDTEEAKLATATEPIAAEVSRLVKATHDSNMGRFRDVLQLPRPR